jgi:hypothetical protein
MLLDKEHIVTILKNYKPQLTSEMGIKRIALFGSYAAAYSLFLQTRINVRRKASIFFSGYWLIC